MGKGKKKGKPGYIGRQLKLRTEWLDKSPSKKKQESDDK